MTVTKLTFYKGWTQLAFLLQLLSVWKSPFPYQHHIDTYGNITRRGKQVRLSCQEGTSAPCHYSLKLTSLTLLSPMN